jgi:hypothetical protein
MTDLSALADEIERLDGPSREMDGTIYVAIYGPDKRMVCGDATADDVPAYTASLDAALTLMPEGSPMELHIRSNMTDAYVWPDDREDGIRGHAATPSLALCAAALRARSENQREPNHE